VPARPLLLLAAAVVLSACNPLTLQPGDDGLHRALYAGPSGAWLEVAVAGIEGFEVSYLVLLSGSPRTCRDAVTGEVEVCETLGAFSFSEAFAATTSVYRPTMSPVDADIVIITHWCRQGGVSVECPASLRVTVRVVDVNGDTIGDLSHWN
jgi:hypothetical protein